MGRPLVVACRVHPVSRAPGCAGWRAACSARCPKLPSPRAAALVTKRPQQPSLPSGPLAMGFTVQRVGRGQPAVPGQHGAACTSAAPGWRPSFSSSAKGACSCRAGEPCHYSRVLRLRRVWTCRRERGGPRRPGRTCASSEVLPCRCTLLTCWGRSAAWSGPPVDCRERGCPAWSTGQPWGVGLGSERPATRRRPTVRCRHSRRRP